MGFITGFHMIGDKILEAFGMEISDEDEERLFTPHEYRPSERSASRDDRTWYPCDQCGFHPLSQIHPDGHTYVASEEPGDPDEYEGRAWWPCIYCGRPSWTMGIHPDS